MSLISASKLLVKNVATVSKSTVCNILKKETQILDKDKIKKVCIDDFAIKKRNKYATVMIDIETRKIVDILESRDYEEVKRWLRSFPNLELISRDASIVYNKAIKDAHQKSIQVSYRFHILKNLTDYCKQYIKRIFKNKIEIGKLENINSGETLHLEKVETITLEEFEVVLNKYEKYKIIFNIVEEFKEILFGEDSTKLNTWITKSKALGIKELNSFITGITRDIEAVENAIIYEYSNWFS